MAEKEARAKDVQRIKNWVEVAAKLGAPVLRVFADTQMRAQTWETVSKGAKRDQVEEWIAADIRTCADHAAKFGVIIGVQNHGDFLKTGRQFDQPLKARLILPGAAPSWIPVISRRPILMPRWPKPRPTP